MNPHRHIDHVGFISAVKNGKAYVTLVNTSACASCSARGVCGVGDSEQKRLEVPVPEKQWKVGDEVIVRLDATAGFMALSWGYVFPFLLIVTVLTTLLTVGLRESISGIISIMVLIPYYASLVLLRKSLRRKLPLKIMKR